MTTQKKIAITLDASTARYLADAMLAAVSKDDVTPVICAAHLKLLDGQLQGIATDRYRAHRVYLDVVKAPKTGDFLMPREALVWMQKNARTYKPRGHSYFRPRVDIESTAAGAAAGDTGRIKITVRRDDSMDDSISYSGPGVKGAFPPVFKLIDTARDAEESSSSVILDVELLAKVRALAPDPFPPRIKFTKASDPSVTKPAPVYIEFGSKNKTFADAILQPHLEARAA